jgi:hypothetical protein
MLRKCQKECKEECDYDGQDIKLSFAQFPAPAKLQSFVTYLNRAFADRGLNFTKEEAQQLILFEMYHELRQTIVIEKVNRVALFELISNIGGALGVWTGLSILSLYQCFVYCMKGVCCNHKIINKP